jgi:hypothetical protein
VEVSFIGAGNWSARFKKSLTCQTATSKMLKKKPKKKPLKINQ